LLNTIIKLAESMKSKLRESKMMNEELFQKSNKYMGVSPFKGAKAHP
jgi:hypothetical protein